MLDSLTLGLVLISVLMAVVLVVVWRGTRDKETVAKSLTRSIVAILTVLPLVFLFSMGGLQRLENVEAPAPVGAGSPDSGGSAMPSDSAPTASEAERKAAEEVEKRQLERKKMQREQSGAGNLDALRKEMQEAAPEPEAMPAPMEMPDMAEPPVAPSIAEPPVAPSMESVPGGAITNFDNEPVTRGLGSSDEEEAAGAPAPEAPAAANGDTKWDVVPVYYGTDRARVEGSERLDYGDLRGHRLELGRALVTVPKSHTVPQIERPWTLRIPLIGIEIGESEDPNEHFTMKEITALSEAELLALVKERLDKSERYRKHALIFVHGFNTTFDYAIYRTAQIAYDLKFDGAPFAYSWPSGGGVLNYTYDRESSGQSQPYLKDFIEMVLNKTGAEAVSLIAHSMGNQPTLQVLKDLKASKPEGVIFNQIILAAPDVDRDNFVNIAREITGLAKGVTLYAAKNDKALAISRNVNGGVPRAGDVAEQGPVILDGIDTIDVTSVSTDSLGLNHSGYAENNALLQDVKALIATGVRPPELRIPSTTPVSEAGKTYWEFHAPSP